MKETNYNLMPALGRHIGRIAPVKDGKYFTEGMSQTNKHYREILVACKDSETLKIRLYDGYMAAFFTQIWKQTAGATGGLKDSEVFEYLANHDFEVYVDVQEEYATPRYSFQEPRK